VNVRRRYGKQIHVLREGKNRTFCGAKTELWNGSWVQSEDKASCDTCLKKSADAEMVA
jgi:hypothetical protein